MRLAASASSPGSAWSGWCRGRARRNTRRPGRLDRADRVRSRLIHRRCRESRDRLAVHRSRLHSEAAEQRAQKLVAAQFFILAPLVAFEALRQLIAGDEPSVSWLGIVLATTSLIGMPLLGVAKRRLSRPARLRSYSWGRDSEPSLRLSRRRRPRRAARERALRPLVARPDGGPRDRRGCRSRGDRELARGRLLRLVLIG